MGKTRSRDSLANTTTNSDNNDNASSSVDAYRQRIYRILRDRDNQVCADCPARDPQWASILLSAASSSGGGAVVEGLGVLVCQTCALLHHSELGEKRCFIKYLKYYHEWTHDELDILDHSGNARVNHVYEAFLNKKGSRSSDYFCKRMISPCAKEEDKRRAKFIKNKYMKWKFLNEAALERALDKVTQRNKRADEQRERRTSRVDTTERERRSSRGDLTERERRSSKGDLTERERRRSKGDVIDCARTSRHHESMKESITSSKPTIYQHSETQEGTEDLMSGLERLSNRDSVLSKGGKSVCSMSVADTIISSSEEEPMKPHDTAGAEVLVDGGMTYESSGEPKISVAEGVAKKMMKSSSGRSLTSLPENSDEAAGAAGKMMKSSSGRSLTSLSKISDEEAAGPVAAGKMVKSNSGRSLSSLSKSSDPRSRMRKAASSRHASSSIINSKRSRSTSKSDNGSDVRNTMEKSSSARCVTKPLEDPDSSPSMRGALKKSGSAPSLAGCGTSSGSRTQHKKTRSSRKASRSSTGSLGKLTSAKRETMGKAGSERSLLSAKSNASSRSVLMDKASDKVPVSSKSSNVRSGLKEKASSERSVLRSKSDSRRSRVRSIQKSKSDRSLSSTNSNSSHSITSLLDETPNCEQEEGNKVAERSTEQTVSDQLMEFEAYLASQSADSDSDEEGLLGSKVNQHCRAESMGCNEASDSHATEAFMTRASTRSPPVPSDTDLGYETMEDVMVCSAEPNTAPNGGLDSSESELTCSNDASPAMPNRRRTNDDGNQPVHQAPLRRRRNPNGRLSNPGEGEGKPAPVRRTQAMQHKKLGGWKTEAEAEPRPNQELAIRSQQPTQSIKMNGGVRPGLPHSDNNKGTSSQDIFAASKTVKMNGGSRPGLAASDSKKVTSNRDLFAASKRELMQTSSRRILITDEDRDAFRGDDQKDALNQILAARRNRESNSSTARSAPPRRGLGARSDSSSGASSKPEPTLEKPSVERSTDAPTPSQEPPVRGVQKTRSMKRASAGGRRGLSRAESMAARQRRNMLSGAA